MESQEQSFITFAEIVEKVAHRKLTLLICIGLALTFALFYNYYVTPLYRASTAVAFEKYSKDNVLKLDFESYNYYTSYVANRIKEIKTFSFARNVYEELPGSVHELFPLPHPLPPEFDTERYIISRIQRNTSLTQSEKTPNVITISYNEENAELAKIIANTITEVLQKSNLMFRRQEFSHLKEFIDEQIQVVEEKLQKSEDALRKFKTNSNITSLEDETREILRRSTEAEILYNQIKTKKGAKEKRLAIIQNKLAEQKKYIAGSLTGASSPLIVKLKEKLIDLEVQSADLRMQNYPEDHPKMVELISEIERTKQNLVRLTMRILQDENLRGIIDPLSQMQNYLEESISLEVELQALHAQEKHLKQILQSYDKRLNILAEKEVVYLGLLRDRDVANKNYVQLLEEREQARLREAAEIGNIHVIDRAETPFIPYRPKKLLNIIIAIFGGIIIGLLIIFFRESFKETVRTTEEVEQFLKLPVLATIPKFKRNAHFSHNNRFRKDNMMVMSALDPLFRDAYSFLWSYLYGLNHREVHSVMITSSIPGEGKSTIAANLAITAARLGQQTLLIDGDFRKPNIHKVFRLPISPGLSDLLTKVTAEQVSNGEKISVNGEKSLRQASLDILSEEGNYGMKEKILTAIDDTLQTTSKKNLRILPIGTSMIDPDIFWTSPILSEILSFLKQTADFVVIDAPPILGIPDVINMASHVDKILLCIEADQTNKKMISRAQKLFEKSKHSLYGVVLNKVELPAIYGKSRYYKYYSSKK